MQLRALVCGVGVMGCVACGPEHPPFVESVSGGGTRNTPDTSVAGDSTTLPTAGSKGVSTGPGGTKGSGVGTGGPGTDKDGVVLPDQHGILDGTQIYFAGLSKDAVHIGDLYKSEYIVSPVLDPSTYYYAFSDSPGGVIIAKELVYWRDGDLYQYVTDSPKSGSPESNDELVPTPGCEAAQQILDFVGSPDGRLLYVCENQGIKYWEGDEVVYDGGAAILALSYGDLALIGPGKYGDAETVSPLNLLTLNDGMPAPITGLPEKLQPLEVRARPDGFSLALILKDGDPVDLWHINANGSAEQVGTYPAPPEGFDEYNEAMAADETRYLLGRIDEVNVIVKSTVGGDSTIIYEEPADAQLLMGSYGKLASMIGGP